MFAHLSMRQLRSVRLHDESDLHSEVRREFMQLIAELPLLESLDLAPHYAHVGAWLPLSTAPALTSLSLRGSLYEQYVGLDQIAKCPRLTRLHINGPDLYGARFKHFFTAPTLRGLQSISLQGFAAAGYESYNPPIPPEDYAATFAALPSLHTLKLLDVYICAALLPHLKHARSLQLLVLQPKADMSMEAEAALFGGPEEALTLGFSLDVLAHLMMIDLPELSCTITIPPAEDEQERQEQIQLRSQIEQSEELRACGQRFILQ
jgi:hypothetical protein